MYELLLYSTICDTKFIEIYYLHVDHPTRIVVVQKEIIDQIKSLRRQLMKDVAYSAISRREAQRNSLLDYIFPSKKKAKAELQRLASIVEQVGGYY